MTLEEQIVAEVNKQMQPIIKTVDEFIGASKTPSESPKHEDETRKDEISDAVKLYLGIPVEDEKDEFDGVSPGIAEYIRQNRKNGGNAFAGKEL